MYTWRGYFPDKKEPEIDENGRNRDCQELHYSLRALYSNCKWISHVYVVIADGSEPPSWIKRDAIARNFEQTRFELREYNLTFVTHSEIFVDLNNARGTENSQAIESNLHRIPGLGHLSFSFFGVFFAEISIDACARREKSAVVSVESTKKGGKVAIFRTFYLFER